MFSVCRGCSRSACIVTKSGPMSNHGSGSSSTLVNTLMPPLPMVCAPSVRESIIRIWNCRQGSLRSHVHQSREQQVKPFTIPRDRPRGPGLSSPASK
jgi:hypothetical protein